MQTAEELLTRTLKLRATKVDEEGTFSGYASTFGNTDAYGDSFAPGAFRKTLADQPTRPLLWSHQVDQPVGTVELVEDARGLRARGRLLLSIAKGREVYEMLRAGVARGLSVGFQPVRSEWKSDGSGRVFKEVALHEVSLVALPANPRAVVTDVRSHQPAVAAEKSKELYKMELEKITAKFDEFGAKLAEMSAKLEARAAEPETRAVAPALLGRALAAMEGGDYAAEVVRGFVDARPSFERHGCLRFEVRTITSAGIVTPEPSDEIGLAGAPSYGAVRRLFRVVRTDSGSVFAVRESSASGWAAAPAAETTTKAQASVALTADTLPVRTVAVWIPAAKQALDDVPGLEAFIRTRLLWALEAEIEEQLLLGSGTGENLKGLMAYAQEFDDSLPGSNPSYADVIGAAAVQVRLAGFTPNFVILHPRDAYRLRFSKDTTGQYVNLPPLPRVVESAALAEGSFIVGDAAQAVIRAREAAQVEIASEHSDYFVRNMVAIRAEERLAFQVISPAAFVKGSLAE